MSIPEPADLKVITVPAFSDNYLWLFHLPESDQAYVVDPGDAAPIEQALTRHGLKLAGVIITHHHPDHTAGIGALIKDRDILVFGPADTVPPVTNVMRDGDTLDLGQQLQFQVLAVPGHTLDHLAYYSPTLGVLFCGDTLFAGGCGRLFEGTPEQMHNSLSRLAALPGSTLVYCAHEYTLANLKFAATVDSENKQLENRLQAVRRQRENDEQTVPTTIAMEIQTNPFLRVANNAVKVAAENRAEKTLSTETQVFATLRQWKDNF